MDMLLGLVFLSIGLTFLGVVFSEMVSVLQGTVAFLVTPIGAIAGTTVSILCAINWSLMIAAIIFAIILICNVVARLLKR
jgi:hypothetical protein